MLRPARGPSGQHRGTKTGKGPDSLRGTSLGSLNSKGTGLVGCCSFWSLMSVPSGCSQGFGPGFLWWLFAGSVSRALEVPFKSLRRGTDRQGWPNSLGDCPGSRRKPPWVRGEPGAEQFTAVSRLKIYPRLRLETRNTFPVNSRANTQGS